MTALKSQNFKLFLQKAISKDLLFAAFQEPGKVEPKAFVQEQNKISNHPNLIEPQTGFLLSPFDAKNKESVWITADKVYSSKNTIPSELEAVHYDRSFTLPESTGLSEQDYKIRLGSLMKEMLSQKVNKVVFSRTIEFKADKTTIASLFLTLCQKYTDCLVFLVNLPGGIQIIGATPEVLIKKQGNTLNTMALAGTAQYKLGGKYVEWGEKEKGEQGIVQTYLENIFNQLNLTFTKEPTTTKFLKSGIAHLVTNYEITSKNEGDFSKLIERLHPTPAVCGNPLNLSKALIDQFEAHKRAFYTGYLGPFDNEGNASLYVNLRSAAISDQKAVLYVGGGITNDSIPADEWEETKLKSKTILDCVE